MADPITTRLDRSYSDPKARATPWPDVTRVLREAELYWLTTVRADGRPHVAPLVGVFVDDAAYFCTGLHEQKARNLSHHTHVALTTGSNMWAQGLDVVVEGRVDRVGDPTGLHEAATAFLSKYGEAWHFGVGDGVLVSPDGEHGAALFRIAPRKVLAFAKQPHGQTTYRFA
jgi:nitroimidazol reductase NimA-like FMN-containing flavoprotein (pyridoxamine 5'-phosphate oxidase superfamily)